MVEEGIMHNHSLDLENEGEYWMFYKDFIAVFSLISICNVEMSVFYTSSIIQPFSSLIWHQFSDTWVANKTAGGSILYDTFKNNHKYWLFLTEEDEGYNPQEECSVVIALYQKYRKPFGQTKQSKFLKIGFTVFKLDEEQEISVHSASIAIAYESPVITTDFFETRKLCQRYKLRKGVYIIIPSTKLPNREGEFFLRFLCVKQKGLLATLNRSILPTIGDNLFVLLMIIFILIFSFFILNPNINSEGY